LRYYGSLMKSNGMIWRTVLAASVIIFLLAQLMVSNAKTSDFAFQSVTKDVASQSPEIDWWSMFQHDPAHTGYSYATTPNTSETRFIINYTRSHTSYASPIVVDSRLIIPGGSASGGYNYSLYSINASSGKLLWKSSLSFYSDATPAAFANRIVIPSSSAPVGAYLYCFNSDDGTLVWKFRFAEGGYGNLPSPIIYNSVVFFASGTTGVAQERGYVAALSLFDMENSTTPKLIWKRSLNSIVTTSPAYSNGKILVGYTTYNELTSSEGDSYVVSLNATDGSPIWSYLVEKVYYTLHSSPTVVDGRVFFGSYGIVYALSEATGELLWKTELSNTDIYASPAVANGRLYVGTLSRRAPDVPAIFAALNAATGGLIWKRQMAIDESPASSPAVADGKVFVSSGRRIYAFNETNGNVIWSFETTGYSGGCSPAVALDSVYVQDEDGYVYCFGPRLYYMITIDPRFYDNRGEPLVPSPSSWTILFPNGTRRTASSPETYDGPMGTYSIESVVWKGFEVLGRPVSILLDSNMTWSPRIDCILPTSISISLSSSTSYIGFKVGINGNLTCNEVGVSYAPILLSYSVTGGESWNDITLVNTSPDGSYSAVWMPSATGNYLVRASWADNSTYPGASTTVNLAVTSSEGKNVFAVESNSTISSLAFNATSLELSFSVSGETGTGGYVRVTIAKSLVSNIADVKVYLDGNQTEYSATSQDDAWILTFTYTHSTHNVTIDLKPEIVNGRPSPLIYFISAAIIITLISGIIIIKRSKQKPSQEEPIVSSGAP